MAAGGLTCHAQRALTIDDCIAYAISHSGEMRRSAIDRQQSRKDITAAALDFLPSVQGQVSGQYSWGRNIDPETNTYNTITTFNNYYNIYASMPLFDGGQTLNAYRRARNARAQSDSEYQKAGDDKAISVMTKFVDAIYNNRCVELAEQKLADSQALLEKTRRLFELGEKSRPDVAQMESQVAEDDYNLLHQQNQARLAMMALESEINWEESDSLCLTPDPTIKGRETNGLSPRPSPSGRVVEVTIATQKAADLRYAWLIARAQVMPSLTFGGGVSTSYYRNLSQGSGSVGGLGSQFHNNMGEYLYVSLSIPLFAPSRWRAARRAKAEWQKAVIEVDDTRRKWHDETAQAIADRDGYRSEERQMERKVAADSLAYHLSRRKYEEGMLSTFDLHENAQTLLESRIKLLQTQLLLIMKERLVRYYEGGRLW